MYFILENGWKLSSPGASAGTITCCYILKSWIWVFKVTFPNVMTQKIGSVVNSEEDSNSDRWVAE